METGVVKRRFPHFIGTITNYVGREEKALAMGKRKKFLLVFWQLPEYQKEDIQNKIIS